MAARSGSVFTGNCGKGACSCCCCCFWAATAIIITMAGGGIMGGNMPVVSCGITTRNVHQPQLHSMNARQTSTQTCKHTHTRTHTKRPHRINPYVPQTNRTMWHAHIGQLRLWEPRRQHRRWVARKHGQPFRVNRGHSHTQALLLSSSFCHLLTETRCRFVLYTLSHPPTHPHTPTQPHPLNHSISNIARQRDEDAEPNPTWVPAALAAPFVFAQ